MGRYQIKRWFFYLILAYLFSLGLSTAHRTRIDAKQVNENGITVREVTGDSLADAPVNIALRDLNTPVSAQGQRTPLILLHGSPGSSRDFELLGPMLAAKRRVIIPDLPGFGQSTRSIPGYSIRAHARHVLQMTDVMRIERFHLLGFSMGGGVALNIADLTPDRVASITMLSSIGVQEMELLGEYHINHALHGLQLGGLWLIREGIPHFGYLDDAMLSVEYARNFYDTDQRPLRGYLAGFRGPMSILHGRKDFLVPVEAAIEHHRIVPQSELHLSEEDHFTVFRNPEVLARTIVGFLDRVDAGSAVTRTTAEPVRVSAAGARFDPSNIPRAVGMTAVVLFILLSVATLVSEDLACITAGVMVSQGRVSFILASAACLFGIFFGDLLLFGAGRVLGRAAIRKAPLKWFIKPEDIERASLWLTRRGPAVIFASRFVPGMRLPTYFAAGALNTSFWRFTIYFFLACLIWTPLLVAISSVFGEGIARYLPAGGSDFLPLAIAVLLAFVVVRLALRLTTFRSRKLLVSRWRRIRHWEFWPPWAFYPPIVLYVIWLGLRYRGLTLFTLANPAIPGGGFVGESKSQILGGLGAAGDVVARFCLIRSSLDNEQRVETALGFIADERLNYPVVVKPDAGQRGTGVVIVESKSELEQQLRQSRSDSIVQEYVGGEEFGVFYYRFPDEARGRILSITEKRFPAVTGDGQRTLEQLILDGERTSAMARLFLAQEARRLEWIPEAGELVQLVRLGTHCRGAVFLDGARHISERLEARIDAVSRIYEGFYFGRYDVRCGSSEDLRHGSFRVIELNGVTSEATSIYDPANSVWQAYRVLRHQWKLAFEIGAQNRRKGHRPSSIRELVRSVRAYRRLTKRSIL